MARTEIPCILWNKSQRAVSRVPYNLWRDTIGRAQQIMLWNRQGMHEKIKFNFRAAGCFCILGNEVLIMQRHPHKSNLIQRETR